MSILSNKPSLWWGHSLISWCLVCFGRSRKIIITIQSTAPAPGSWQGKARTMIFLVIVEPEVWAFFLSLVPGVCCAVYNYRHFCQNSRPGSRYPQCTAALTAALTADSDSDGANMQQPDKTNLFTIFSPAPSFLLIIQSWGSEFSKLSDRHPACSRVWAELERKARGAVDDATVSVVSWLLDSNLGIRHFKILTATKVRWGPPSLPLQPGLNTGLIFRKHQ